MVMQPRGSSSSLVMESCRHHPRVLPAAKSPNTAPTIVPVLRLQEEATESGLGVAWMHLTLEQSSTLIIEMSLHRNLCRAHMLGPFLQVRRALL